MTDRLEFRPTGAAAAAEQLAGLATPDAVRAKILIVDDDQRNLLAASEILADPAIDMVLANSPEEALRRALREDFAVILLDVQMPRMDGYEVAALIRSRSRTSRVPILFLTAHNKDDMHIFRGYSAGAVDYVFKPIQPLVLKSKVDVFVDLYRKTEEIKRKAAAEKQLLLENLRVRGEKLEAEQALRRQAEHQAAVLRGLPIALYTSPLGVEDRRLHFTNDSIERITGFSREAFAGSSLWESRLEAEDRNRVLADLRTVSEVGAVALEYRWRNADGTERHILDQIAVNRDESGTGVELFGMWFDVTERKELELSLQHASKLEAVGRLTGGIAHDFNNLLMIISGSAHALRRVAASDPRAFKALHAIEGAAQRGGALTRQLLTFARRQQLNPQAINVAHSVAVLSDVLESGVGSQVHLMFDIDPRTWPVIVDPAEFETALVNLVLNARDAMHKGGTITVSATNLADSEQGERVEITVSDTGEGIAPDVLAKVFDPFFTTKPTGKGTGLGLSQVHGFVHQAGGDVRIESGLGEGTSVVITLPRAQAEEADCRGDSSAVGWGKVLLVEDNPDVASASTILLEQLGYSVRWVPNASEALREVEKNDVDLVFSDVVMPGEMDGLSLARAIRHQRPDLPVLLATGYSDAAREAMAKFPMIRKPYELQDLSRALTALRTR